MSKQCNSYDCGVFVILYAQAVVLGQSLSLDKVIINLVMHISLKTVFKVIIRPFVPSKLSNVHATYHDGLSTEGHVLVAAQGDGVHVLDVSLQTVLCKSCSPSNSPCHLQIDFNYDIEDALFQT